MSDRKGVEGLAICSSDCENMYPQGEANNGYGTCPECRGEDREPDRIETDPVLEDYEAKVWFK